MNRDTAFQKFFIPLVYSLVFIVGCLGNGLVLLVLLKHHHLRSTTDIFLVHLAVADLLMLITFPFTVAEYSFGWIFGDFMCKSVGVFSRLNFLCSSLLLGCISVDRYMAIIHAVHAFRTRSGMAVYLSCFGVWILSFLLSIPNLFLLGTQNNGNLTECTYSQKNFTDNSWWQANRFIIHIVGFLCPLFIMGFCYAHIVAALYKSTRREKKRAVRVAIVITGVFFLCWTPYNMTLFLDTLDILDWVQDCMLRMHLSTAISVTEVLGSVHCCLNPLLYAFVGVKFRNDALRVLQQAGCLSLRLLGKTLTPERKSSIMDSETGTVLSSF
ncbi:C-X-C chemokine receptor type 5 [Pelobates cultripes]|uniref:C-X-C chemokine receptor type 5 n=1 Tax=Pelobates cultripes TaxID=61616 RepID=A0AAD1T5D3_PELCU|nr:C-X-C chemokine receptor type 5 [Pelobates cultripes]